MMENIWIACMDFLLCRFADQHVKQESYRQAEEVEEEKDQTY